MTGVRLLGLTGASGAGKTAVAELLAGHHDYERCPLDAPLLEIMMALDPLVVDDKIVGGINPASAISAGGLLVAARDYPDLQRMIDRLRDAIGPAGKVALWAQRAEAAMAQGKRVVVDDIRSLRDVDAIHEAGGIVARVVRPGFTENTGDLGLYPGSFPIMNDGDLENLKAAVADVASLLPELDPVTGKRIRYGRA